MIHAYIEKTIQYLSSAEALKSIEQDPYWPKWNTPWWHMLLLHEMELTKNIPAVAISKMVEILKTYYLPTFPITSDELPVGADPCRKIACFCAVGGIYQVLFAYGVDVDQELPWMRPWFFRYQLPDGGLNCDEKAYIKQHPKSSIISTLPCLEAVLFCCKRKLLPEEIAFLDKGANYLLKQRLFRKVSTGEVIREDWQEIRFPRFYEYDFLRGFYFLVKWRDLGLGKFFIPDELVEEVEALVARQMTAEGIQLRRYHLCDKRSYNPAPDGTWGWGEASEFDLLKAVSFNGSICLPLTKKWNEVKPKTALVTKAYEITYKNPLKLNIGDVVKIEKRESDPDFLGWVYCSDSRGIRGWISERYLNEDSSSDAAMSMVIKNYDATELTVAPNEKVKIYYEEFGWAWSKNALGAKGWIPKKNLQVL
ncbi:MAG: hypothetical protein HQK52_17960 [Oligoflexia bacterium]|nr:hypothetical protein [Oligoflexia bacterium]